MYLLDEMQLPQVFKWGDCGEVSTFISIVTNSFCLVTSFCDCVSNQPLQFGPWPMLTYVHLQRDLYFHSMCSLENSRLTKHIGGLLLGGSVPLNCYVWLLALCLFITIVKAPSLCPPPPQNLYKNIFERLSQGPVVPWQQLQQYRLLPASETISCFRHLCGKITKETFLTNRIRILAQRNSSVPLPCELWCEIDH